MEAADAFLHSRAQLRPHHLLRGVLGELEVVDAGHDTRKVVICCQRRLVRLPHDGEGWIEATEPWEENMIYSDEWPLDDIDMETHHQWVALDFL
jgi:hypothetical protein